MASARRIAARMATDTNVRRVVQTVVPVAGLLAETAVTLTEAEVAQLRRIAEIDMIASEELLLTADRFLERMPELGLGPSPWLPSPATLTRSVVPACRSRTNTSRTPLVSPATRLVAVEVNTTKRPSALIPGLPLVSFA